MIGTDIPLSWQQLIRQKTRFAVATIGIGFSVILILVQLGFKNALFDANTLLPILIQSDLVMLSPQAKNFGNLNSFPRRRLFQAQNLAGVESTSPLYAQLGSWRNPKTKLKAPVLVLGFNPAQIVLNIPELVQQGQLLNGADIYLLDRLSAREYRQVISELDKGEKQITELQDRKITVVRLFTLGGSFTADTHLITSDQNFFRVFSQQSPSSVNLGLVRLKDGSDPTAIARALEATLENDVKVFTKAEYVNFEKSYWQNSTSIGFIFSFGVVIGFVVGVIIVYQIIYGDVLDHIAEYATLKAMGYRNIYLFGVVYQQVLILAIAGYIPGALISFGLYNFLRNVTNLPVIFNFGQAFEVLFLTILMCLISGTITLQKLRSADPADIF
jgi:putative ABC transport system permease protein